MTKEEIINADLADEIYTALEITDWNYESERLKGLGYGDIAGDIKLAVMSFRLALDKLNSLQEE